MKKLSSPTTVPQVIPGRLSGQQLLLCCKDSESRQSGKANRFIENVCLDLSCMYYQQPAGPVLTRIPSPLSTPTQRQAGGHNCTHNSARPCQHWLLWHLSHKLDVKERMLMNKYVPQYLGQKEDWHNTLKVKTYGWSRNKGGNMWRNVPGHSSSSERLKWEITWAQKIKWDQTWQHSTMLWGWGLQNTWKLTLGPQRKTVIWINKVWGTLTAISPFSSAGDSTQGLVHIRQAFYSIPEGILWEEMNLPNSALSSHYHYKVRIDEISIK